MEEDEFEIEVRATNIGSSGPIQLFVDGELICAAPDVDEALTVWRKGNLEERKWTIM